MAISKNDLEKLCVQARIKLDFEQTEAMQDYLSCSLARFDELGVALPTSALEEVEDENGLD